MALLQIALGCQSESRPGATERGGAYQQVISADQYTVSDAAERALADLGFAITRVDRPAGATHSISASDRQGTRYTVRIEPTVHLATTFSVRISPGKNDAASIAVLEKIRKRVTD